MALTDRPWRCKSRIMTSSPSLITASSLPPAEGPSVIRGGRPAIPGMPGMAGSHENWGNFKCHKWGELLRHSQRAGDGVGGPAHGVWANVLADEPGGGRQTLGPRGLQRRELRCSVDFDL